MDRNVRTAGGSKPCLPTQQATVVVQIKRLVKSVQLLRWCIRMSVSLFFFLWTPEMGISCDRVIIIQCAIWDGLVLCSIIRNIKISLSIDHYFRVNTVGSFASMDSTHIKCVSPNAEKSNARNIILVHYFNWNQ